MATIQVRAKDVDAFGAAQHLYIIYTNDAGQQRVLRGGPENSDLEGTLIGNIQVVDRAYEKSSAENNFLPAPDWDDTGSNPSQTIWVGTDAQMQPLISAMRIEMNRINAAGYDYNLPFIETILPAWGDLNEQNSNTVVMDLSKVAGLDGQVRSFITSQNLNTPGAYATLEHSFFEKNTDTLVDAIEDSNKTVTGFLGDLSKGLQQNASEMISQNRAFVTELLAQQPNINGSVIHGVGEAYYLHPTKALAQIASSLNMSLSQLESIAGNQYLQDRHITLPNGAFLYLWKQGDQLHYTPMDNDFAYVPPTTLGSWTNTVSQNLQYATTLKSPLVLDLDGDGVELKHVDNGVYFDIDNDGFAEKVGWVKGDDGQLAMDRNNNGVIDNITELYGDDEIEAFEKLRLEDSDLDGVITASDQNFGRLLVWQDRNEDGRTDADELKTLVDLGIASISLNEQAQDRWLNENHISGKATFIQQGITKEIFDVHYLNDDMNSTFVGYGDISKDVTIDLETAFLPKSRGYGELPALHIAMSQNHVLLDKVRELNNLSLNNFSEIFQRTEDILLEWARVEENNPLSRNTISGNHFDARKADFLDAFTGQDFLQLGAGKLVGLEASYELNKAWNEILAQMTGRLLVQGLLSSLFPNASYDFKTDQLALGDNLQTIVDKAAEEVAITGTGSYEFWISLGRILIQHQTELGVGTEQIRQELALAAGQKIYVSDGDFVLKADDAANVLNGTRGVDAIEGLAGNDSIYANDGDDIINGGTGADSIEGGDGSDRIDAGDDNDTVHGNDGDDIVRHSFGNDYIYGDDGNDFLEGGGGADYIDGGNGIDVVGYSGYGTTGVQVNLALGTAHGGDAEGDTLVGIEGFIGSSYSDRLTGDAHNNSFNGDPGDDYLEGLGGDDAFFGEDGNDTLLGGEGNDWLEGFRGNDYIDGGNGNDAVNYSHFVATEGVVVDLNNGTAKDYFGDNDIVINVEIVYGSVFNDTLKGAASDNLLVGAAGNDFLEGNGGNDTLKGGSGNDIYAFNQGFGQDVIQNDGTLIDSDSIQFGNGITLADLSVQRAGNNLVISLINSTNTVTIQNWYLLPQNKIEQLTFADGSNIAIEVAFPEINSAQGDNAIIGTDNADVMYGYEGNDALRGEGGDDRVYGNIGADTLYGGAGNDELDGGNEDTETNYVYGEEGKDHLAGGIGNDVLDGGTEDDIISDTNGFNTLIGGGGNDHITGSGELYGNEGDDILITDVGNHEYYAGENNILLDNQFSNSTLVGGTGNDIFKIVKPLYPFATVTHTVIEDFEINNQKEILDIAGYGADAFTRGITDMSQLAFAETTDGTVITLPGQSTITLKGVAPTQLTSTRLGLGVANDILINQTTLGEQQVPHLATLANSNIVAIWNGAPYGVVGRILDNKGMPVGDEFPIETGSTDGKVVPLANGGFAVSWTNYGAEHPGVYARIFSEDGAPATDTFAVNTPMVGLQANRSSPIVMADNSIFISWISEATDFSFNRINGQSFDLSGHRIGSEKELYTTETTSTGNGVSMLNAIALSNGNMVVSWSQAEESGDSSGYLRLYNAEGIAQTAALKLNNSSSSAYLVMNLPLANGDFVAFWNNWDPTTWLGNIYGQKFDVTGNKIGPAYVVNTGKAQPDYMNAGFSNVALLHDGNVAFTWTDSVPGHIWSDLQEVFLQVMTVDGQKVEEPVQLNEYTDRSQNYPATTETPTGDIIAAWMSQGQDGSGSGIFGKHIDRTIPHLNVDVSQPTITYNEDQEVQFNALNINSNNPEVTISLQLSDPLAGSLASSNEANVASSYSRITGTWYASGSQEAVNTLLSDLIFLPTANYSKDIIITYTISDGQNPDIVNTLTLQGTAVNDKPTLSISISTLETSTQDIQGHSPQQQAGILPVIEQPDGQTVLPSAIDHETLLLRNTAEVTVGFKNSVSGWDDAIGWYKIAADGTITNPQLLFTNAHAVTADQAFKLGTLETGSSVGFFIISNAINHPLVNATTGELINLETLDITTGTWEFRTLDNSPITTESTAPELYFTTAAGDRYHIEAPVFHATSGGEHSLNSDSGQHAAIGWDATKQDLLLGFEDLPGGGDNDYNDVLFYVDLGDTNERYDYSAAPHLGATIADIDSSELSQLTVTIADGYQQGDFLRLSEPIETGITITEAQNTDSYKLTFSGRAPIESYEVILHSLQFIHTAESPALAGTRTIQLKVWDDQGDASDIAPVQLLVEEATSSAMV